MPDSRLDTAPEPPCADAAGEGAAAMDGGGRSATGRSTGERVDVRPAVADPAVADLAALDSAAAEGIGTGRIGTGRIGTDPADAAFEAVVAPLRRELLAHCYRMLGSMPDAEDAVQEAMVRAWRGLGGFEGRSSVRAWLYRISTNVCLTTIDRRGKRALPWDLGPSSEVAQQSGAEAEVAWLGPVPDLWLDDGRAVPHARWEQRESVELAFVAALQHLPGNQRAALLLFEVLGFSAREIAEVLDTTTASVNSALQRARRIVAEKVPEQSQQETLRELGDARLAELVESYTSALERGDAEGLLALLTADATWSMPPLPAWYQGRAAITEFLVHAPFTVRWRHLPVRANGQQAVGCYIWDEHAGRFDGRVIDVLTLRGGRIAAVTAFIDQGLFARFGLPEHLPPE